MSQPIDSTSSTLNVEIDVQTIIATLDALRVVQGLPRTANRYINDLYRLLGHKPPHEQARDQRNHARRQRQMAHHKSS